MYAWIAFLRDRLLSGLRELPRVRIVSGFDSGGMVSFLVDGIDSLELQKKLAAKNVRTCVIGEYKYGYMRLSPHVYTSVEEIDRVVDCIGAA